MTEKSIITFNILDLQEHMVRININGKARASCKCGWCCEGQKPFEVLEKVDKHYKLPDDK